MLAISLKLLLPNSEKIKLGIIFKEKVCIASGISGVILQYGKPVPNLTLRRKLSWKTLDWDQWDSVEEVVTNKKGVFKFESRWEKIRSKLMTQPAFAAEIEAANETIRETVIFTTTKFGFHEYSEFDEKPINFRCELTEERRKVKTKLGFIGTNCYWD